MEEKKRKWKKKEKIDLKGHFFLVQTSSCKNKIVIVRSDSLIFYSGMIGFDLNVILLIRKAKQVTLERAECFFSVTM